MKTKSFLGIVVFAVFFTLFGCNRHGYLHSTAFMKAEYCLNNRKYDQAIHFYRQVIKKGKNQNQKGKAYFSLAECYRLSKDTIIKEYYLAGMDLLKEDYNERNQLNYSKQTTLKILALSYFYMEDYPRAAYWCRRYWWCGSDDPDIFEKYVISLRKSGQDATADSIVNKYIDEHGDVYKGVD